jgi:bis(5'-nucleosyl)-tetraphosphatase (symmetrical)
MARVAKRVIGARFYSKFNYKNSPKNVHGCAKELSQLIDKAKQKVGNLQLLLVGDLFTKGPDPVGVLELIEQHNALCIKGNHDWALWSSIIHAQKKGVRTMPEHTQQTLHLIRYHKRQIMDLLSTLPHCFRTEIVPAVKRKGWEASYSMSVVHAGIDPTLGLEQTPERVVLTARYMKWDTSETGEGESPKKRLILIPSAYRAEVLSAQSKAKKAASNDENSVHHSSPNSAQNSTQYSSHHSAQNAHIAPTQGLGNNPSHNPSMAGVHPERFRWHELYHGPELLVFGHDAKQGLFRKTLPTGRPICIGIDTGCTYGKALTGYLPEWDDALQIQAPRAYFDIEKNVIAVRNPSRQAV